VQWTDWASCPPAQVKFLYSTEPTGSAPVRKNQGCSGMLFETPPFDDKHE